MSFWAIEVLPGKVYSSKPLFPLKVTKAVLPPHATDAGRSVVQVKVDDKLFSVASLKLNHEESVPLELIFEDTEEEIHFVVTGKNPVHLVGYYVPSDEEEDGFSDEDGEHFAFDEDDEDLIASDNEDEEEIPAPKAPAQSQKRKPEEANGNAAKKAKAEEHAHAKPQAQGTPKAQGQQQKQAPKQSPQGQQTPKGGKPQQGQQPKESDSAAPAKEEVGFTKNLGDKLKATVLRVGQGDKRAAKGEIVTVKYVGKLESGKVFDKSESFQFRLGAGEVIQGWDRGVLGMAIGEKRSLSVPPALAYGKDGIKGTIPQNATLNFDVELVRVGRK